jgi:hypothetical protein
MSTALRATSVAPAASPASSWRLARIRPPTQNAPTRTHADPATPTVVEPSNAAPTSLPRATLIRRPRRPRCCAHRSSASGAGSTIGAGGSGANASSLPGDS